MSELVFRQTQSNIYWTLAAKKYVNGKRSKWRKHNKSLIEKKNKWISKIHYYKTNTILLNAESIVYRVKYCVRHIKASLMSKEIIKLIFLRLPELKIFDNG